MSEDTAVTFVLPGRVVDALRDSNWPTDNPRGWADVHVARFERRGRGYRKFVWTTLDRANDLADYLFSLADVNTGTENADTRLAAACRDAIARIEDVI